MMVRNLDEMQFYSVFYIKKDCVIFFKNIEYLKKIRQSIRKFSYANGLGFLLIRIIILLYNYKDKIFLKLD